MIKNIVSVAVAVVGTGALLTGCNFDQPSAGCVVQDASTFAWYAKYDLKDGQNITADCQAKIVRGETWGVFKFADPGVSSVLTIRPQGLYSRAATDPCDLPTQATLRKKAQDAVNAETDSAKKAELVSKQAALEETLRAECGWDEQNNKPVDNTLLQTAQGGLKDETDPQDFCSTSEWKDATVYARPATDVWLATPPDTIKYQFDNVKVYSAPDAPGTQIAGDLTYTRGNCTFQYSVRALWPSVACVPGSTSQAESCGEGSGINPDFAVECDATLKRCVASKPIPSFKVDRN